MLHGPESTSRVAGRWTDAGRQPDPAGSRTRGAVPSTSLLAWTFDADRDREGEGRAVMHRPEQERGMAPGMVALFAVACGISAANLYYAQPLLPLISRDLRVGSGTTALVITAAQIGYGLGLALIVPLGDILIRRRLVPGILLVAAAALLAARPLPTSSS